MFYYFIFNQNVHVSILSDHPKVVMWSYFTVAIAGEMLGYFNTATRSGQGKTWKSLQDQLTLTPLLMRKLKTDTNFLQLQYDI